MRRAACAFFSGETLPGLFVIKTKKRVRRASRRFLPNKALLVGLSSFSIRVKDCHPPAHKSSHARILCTLCLENQCFLMISILFTLRPKRKSHFCVQNACAKHNKAIASLTFLICAKGVKARVIPARVIPARVVPARVVPARVVPARVVRALFFVWVPLG